MNTNKSIEKSNKEKLLYKKKILCNSDKNYYDYIRNLKNSREELNECGNDYNTAFMML